MNKRWLPKDVEYIRKIIEDISCSNYLCQGIPNNPEYLIIQKVIGNKRSYILKLEYLCDSNGHFEMTNDQIMEHIIVKKEDNDTFETKLCLFEIIKLLYDHDGFRSKIIIGDGNHVLLQRLGNSWNWYLCTFQYIGDDSSHEEIINHLTRKEDL